MDDIWFEIYRILTFCIYLLGTFAIGYLLGRQKEHYEKAKKVAEDIETCKNEYEDLLAELRKKLLKKL